MISQCVRCNGSGVSSVELADAIAEYVRGASDAEALMVSMADLATAVGRVNSFVQSQVADFVSVGPKHIEERDVEFRSRSHQSSVLAVWREMNGMERVDGKSSAA